MKQIKPLQGINAKIQVPGSKSYTQRALITSALAEGESVLKGALISEDTQYLMKALGLLGANVAQEGRDLIVKGTGAKLKLPPGPLFLGNNGTGLRFITSTVSIGKGTFVVDGTSRMRQRPIQPLVDALAQLGVTARCVDGNGCPPVEIRAAGLAGGKTRLARALSSQYVSSLLLASPYAEQDTEIEIADTLPSWPYVKLTLDVMAQFGVDVSVFEERLFHIKAGQAYQPREYMIEGDVSSATYFMAAAAIAGGTVIVPNIRGNSMQGDLRFLEILEIMGCKVAASEEGIEITGPLSNHEALSFDLNDAPDMVPALAVVCAFREGETVLENISHLRVKESDRVAALVHELKKIGVRAEEKADGMIIQGMASHGAEIDCYDDHRIAMSFAVAGLAQENITIKDPGCVKKSFPDFWEKLELLG